MWEYSILLHQSDAPDSFEELQLQAAEMEAKLNAKGREGWELIAGGNGIYIFKRWLPEPVEARPKQRVQE